MFKFLTKVQNKFMSYISNEIKRLINKKEKISLDFYKTMYLNSYESKILEPYLSDEALIWKIENAIKYSNKISKYELPRHYGEYLSTDGITELLKRFKEKLNVQ